VVGRVQVVYNKQGYRHVLKTLPYGYNGLRRKEYPHLCAPLSRSLDQVIVMFGGVDIDSLCSGGRSKSLYSS
jgi:hypothetical protein